MAHDTTQGEHVGAKKRIWQVFIILSILTLVEVALGIVKPGFLVNNDLVSLSYLNWIFIVLTIVKAYYIIWAFMHMEHESPSLRRVVVWSGIFLISYLIAILLIEGLYIQEVYTDGYITWDF